MSLQDVFGSSHKVVFLKLCILRHPVPCPKPLALYTRTHTHTHKFTLPAGERPNAVVWQLRF